MSYSVSEGAFVLTKRSLLPVCDCASFSAALFGLVFVLSVLCGSVQGQKLSFWKAREVELSGTEHGSEVVVAVWDTGVDYRALPQASKWINPAEKLNALDTDQNGFVDDVNGIAFDLKEKYSTSTMQPLPQGLAPQDLNSLVRDMKGNADALFGVSSDEARDVFQKTLKATPEENRVASEQLIWFGEYAHGTQMASICVRGNPFIQVMSIRQQLSHRPPKPEIAVSRRRANAYRKAVEYMKSNGVRVANLSWSRWQDLFVKAAEMHDESGSEESHLKLASEILKIEHDALFDAIANAPEILFVTTAGNAGHDMQEGAIPQKFELPNIIRVGATTSRGRPTLNNKDAISDVYAHGHKVATRTISGVETFTMGTSAACANVTNLAAKLFAIKPELTVQDVKKLILETSTSYKGNRKTLLIHSANALTAARE